MSNQNEPDFRPEDSILEDPRLQEIYNALWGDPSINNMLISKSRGGGGTFPGGMELEDIKMDAFLALPKHIRKTGKTDLAELKPYYYAICRNIASGLFKKPNSREEPLGEEHGIDWITDMDLYEGKKLEPELREIMIQEALKQLSTQCQKRMRLRFEENLSAQQIAKRTGLSSSRSVDKRMSKCYTRYRKVIAEKFGLLNKHLRKKKKP